MAPLNNFYIHYLMSFHTPYYLLTRMHSSRMRTVHCSGRLGGGRCLPGGCLPGGACLGDVCWGVSAQVGCLPGGVHLPSVDRILDTCLWKHYLSATTVADGKKLTSNRGAHNHTINLKLGCSWLFPKEIPCPVKSRFSFLDLKLHRCQIINFHVIFVCFSDKIVIMSVSTSWQSYNKCPG